MKNKLNEIYENTVPHSVFLSRKSVDSCMVQSYNLGVEDVFEWLSKNDYLSDKVQYIREEWQENQRKNNNP